MSHDRRYSITRQEGTERTSWYCSLGCGIAKGSGTRPTFEAAVTAAEAHYIKEHA